MTGIVVPSSYGRTSGDLWEIALLKLKNKNELSFDIGRTDRRVVLEEVLSEVLKREQICKEKRWKWKNRKGETIIVRDVFAKMVKWIHKFKEIGDTIIQYDPAHAALPWAAVRFVLQIVVNDEQMQAAMAEGLEIIFNLIARYEIVERMFLQTQSGVQGELSEGIVKLYAAILFYLSEIYRFYARSTTGRLASSIIRTIETVSQECIDKIKSAESQVHKYTQLASHEVARATGQEVSSIRTSVQQVVPILEGVNETRTGMQQMRNQVSDLARGLEELQSILTDLGRPIPRMAFELSAIKDDLDENERLKLFGWLTDVRYSRHHREKAKSLLKGSGQWLLEKPEFVDWMTSSTSSILWLHGIPGSGKSMLVAVVIEYLRPRNEGAEHPAPIGYFYCARNTNEPERADPEVILRSILEQLSSTNQHCPIREPVSRAYLLAKDDARGRPPDPLTLKETVDVILELLKDNPATIVLDGLDECDPRKRQGLLNALQKIIRESDNIVKIFVSSRDNHDLVHHLEETPNLYIHAADNRKDIESFVHSTVFDAIKEERMLCGRVSDDLRKLITSTLIEKARGMFRLVSLHIDALCDPQEIKTEENVRIALRRLPKDLQKSYSIIIEQIRNSEDPNPKIAENTMRWLLCAQTTLTSETLPLAVSVNFRSNSGPSSSEILSVCANLVVLESGVFRFAHLSVREYLENHRDYDFQGNHALAAEFCLTYLLEDSFPLNKSSPSPPRKSTWLAYCDLYWMKHVKMAPDRRNQGTLRECLLKFLSSQKFLQLLPRTYITRDHITSEQSLQTTLPQLRYYCENGQTNILFVACAYGLSEIVAEIVSDVESVAFNLQICNLIGMNCVELAAFSKQSFLIPILYDASQHGNLPDAYWYSVIKTTVDRQNNDTTFRLIEQVLGCTRQNFLTEHELKIIISGIASIPPSVASWERCTNFLSHLARSCEATKLLNIIMEFGNKAMLFEWITLDQRLRIDGEMLLSIVSKGHGNITEILLSREENLSINDEAMEMIISTDHTETSNTPYWSNPKSWANAVPRLTCVQLLLQRPEKIIIPRHLLKRIVTLWNTLTTQMLLQRKENFSATNEIIDELLSTRNERIRDLLRETVIQNLDTYKIEHTSLILSLGDSNKVNDLLYKTPIEISAQVIKAVAKNSRYGKEIMKLLLTKNPGIRISKDLLQIAMSTGNLEITNLLFSHVSAVEVEERALAVVNEPRRE